MSSAPLKSLLASTSFRLSLVCAAVIIVAFVLAGLGTWLVTRSAAEQAGRQRIELEMDLLQSEVRDGGISAAIAAIEARQRTPGALEYRLLDVNGRVLGGNLDIATPSAGWSTLYLDRASDGAASPDLILLNEAIPGGGRLIIAEDLERTEWVRYAVLRTLSWIALGALVLSVSVGYFAARGTLQRMDKLIAAMARVGGGDLSARLPVGAGPSDVDVLGRRINAMLERIDLLVRNLKRVSSDIAHDLRTPLTHVRQQLDEACSASDLETAKAAAHNAQVKIDDLMRIFAATLRLAEIEAGASHARFAPVNLAELLERVADAYRPDIESGGGSLEVDVPAPIFIQGDADLLAQALANLLDNSITHAPANVARAIRLRANADTILLAVEDRGPGVPVADLDRVLEPFVRLDHSRGAPGAGLGLSIVSAVARLHGAQVTLKDANPGLRVEIEWPIRARLPTEEAPNRELAPPV